jgi:hypothetical protein
VRNSAMESIVGIDKALNHIEKGNQYEKERNYWQAAISFGNAMSELFHLALSMSPKNQEEERICELFQAQCRDYLHKARTNLIIAMKEEDKEDFTDKDGDPKFITISSEEAEIRVRLFATLYSKELEMSRTALDLPQIHEKSKQQVSLEDRLSSLNASLPSNLKTEEERMKDFDQGLKRLGVNVTSHADKPATMLEPPVSTEDQITLIMAQAIDEVHYGKHDATQDEKQITVRNNDNDDDDIELSDDDDDDIDDDDESSEGSKDDSLSPILLNQKRIRKTVVNAYVKLAHVITILDSTENSEGKKEAVVKKTEDDYDQAQILLLKAKKYLGRAASFWIVE